MTKTITIHSRGMSIADLRGFLRAALAEDVGPGDVTTLADGNVVETIRSNTGAAEE